MIVHQFSSSNDFRMCLEGLVKRSQIVASFEIGLVALVYRAFLGARTAEDAGSLCARYVLVRTVLAEDDARKNRWFGVARFFKDGVEIWGSESRSSTYTVPQKAVVLIFANHLVFQG